MVFQHALQVVSQHALQVSSGVSRPTSWGGGVSRPTHRGACIPACTEADFPPPPIEWLLPLAVRILLECILVQDKLSAVRVVDSLF